MAALIYIGDGFVGALLEAVNTVPDDTDAALQVDGYIFDEFADLFPPPVAVSAWEHEPLPRAPRCLLPRYRNSGIGPRVHRPRTFSHVQSRRHKRKRWLQSLRSEK